MQWEYQLRTMGWVQLHNHHPVQQMLDEMGGDGWELVSVHRVGEHPTGYADYTFKRKAAAARKNGQKGGWPKGKRRKGKR